MGTSGEHEVWTLTHVVCMYVAQGMNMCVRERGRERGREGERGGEGEREGGGREGERDKEDLEMKN